MDYPHLDAKVERVTLKFKKNENSILSCIL